MRTIFVVLLSMFISPAIAVQSNLWSPTTGTVSGLQLTLNYNNALSALASCNSGNAAPTNDQSGVAVEGQCWIDTSSTPHRVKIFDSTGGQWLLIGYLDAVNHIWTPIVAGGAVNNVASNATTDLCSTPPAFLQVTGTTTINSFGSNCVTGQTKWVVFNGALTLTNSGSLILPNNGANITTSAGDVIQAVYLGAGAWRVLDYVPTGGLAPPATMTLIGDVNYIMLATDNIIATNAALSVARTITLVAANAVPPGKSIEVCDRANGVTSVNTLSVNRAGADTIVAQGTTVTGIVLQNAGACINLKSDGVSKWISPLLAMVPQVTPLTTGSGLTYTTPVGAKYLRVRMAAGGGGGGAQTVNGGGTGGNSSFGAWVTVGGVGGNAAGGAPGNGGGGGANGTGTQLMRIGGTTGFQFVTGQVAAGGASSLGGAGINGTDAATNSGSGGAGANSTGGSGGGAGEFVEFVINAPAASYTYTVGALGAGGAAGGAAGHNGAAGIIVVEAYFQ